MGRFPGNVQFSEERTGAVIIITRPKLPYGRQGLAGSRGKDTVRQVHFGTFWGFLNVSLLAYGAQLELDIVA